MKNMSTSDAQGVSTSLNAQADVDSSSVSTMQTSDPVALFQGYDSFMSTPRALALTGTSGSSGVSGQLSYMVCTSIEQISNALNISASVSASCGFGSMDAKSEFLNKLDVTNTSVHVVVYASAVTSAIEYLGASLSITPPDTASEFFMVYGDSFVSALNRGGEYYAVYSFQSSSIDEQTAVTMDLSGNGIGAEGTISTGLQASLNTAYSSITTAKSFVQNMSGSTTTYPDIGDVVTFALSFASTVTPDGAVTLSYSTSSYLRVPGFPSTLMDDFFKINTNVESFVNTPGNPGWSGLYANTYALANSVAAVQEIYSTYAYTGDTALTQNGQLVQADLQTLTTLFNSLEYNPTQTVTVPTLNSSGWQAPTLNISLGTTALSTGNGDQTYSDVSTNNVYLKTTISSLSLMGDEVLDSIAITYATGNATTTVFHGGSGGNGPAVLNMSEGDRITGITTLYGDVINQITFTTTGSSTTFTWPPSPKPCDYTGSWTEAGSTRLLGFSGSFGDFLDRMNVIAVTFSPATFGPA